MHEKNSSIGLPGVVVLPVIRQSLPNGCRPRETLVGQVFFVVCVYETRDLLWFSLPILLELNQSFGVVPFWPNREYMTGKAIRSESFHYCSIEESIKDPLDGACRT